MKKIWVRPFRFWDDFRLSVINENRPEPSWFQFMTRDISFPQGIAYSKLSIKDLEFSTDKIRKMYYKDYPHEMSLYAETPITGEKKYYKTPMDIFLQRHFELVSSGMDEDIAYLQCQEEKTDREACERLEKFFCAHQAVRLYHMDPTKTSYEDHCGAESPYVKARKVVMRQRRNDLQELIEFRREIGDYTPLTHEETGYMEVPELQQYMVTHPEDLIFFDEETLFDDSYDEFKDQLIDQSLTENALLASKEEETELGGEFEDDAQEAAQLDTLADDNELIDEYESPLHYHAAKKFRLDKKRFLAHIDYNNVDNDTNFILDRTQRLILAMAHELDVDIQNDSIFDTLTEQGRQEVLLQWSAAFPDSVDMAHQHHFSSKKSFHVQNYHKNINVSAYLDRSRAKLNNQDRIHNNFENFLKKWNNKKKDLKF